MVVCKCNAFGNHSFSIPVIELHTSVQVHSKRNRSCTCNLIVFTKYSSCWFLQKHMCFNGVSFWLKHCCKVNTILHMMYCALHLRHYSKWKKKVTGRHKCPFFAFMLLQLWLACESQFKCVQRQGRQMSTSFCSGYYKALQ